ncbi:MAG TPA: hypothetical protein ENJ82_12895 [Bacteroidetes bacterium]|nr:hypothetical protein [Bacteroidota bacterium]
MNALRHCILAICLLAPAALFGQEVIFCLDHTLDGSPLARSNEFELESIGQELDFLFRQPGVIQTEKLFFFVDIFQGDKFIEHDTKSCIPSPGENWAMVRYRFEHSGNYRVVILNSDKQKICQDTVFVNVREEENSPAYFKGAHLIFCNNASSGVADTSFQNYRLPTASIHAQRVLLKHDRPLSTGKIYVDIWLGAGETAGSYLETVEFQLNPHWNYTQFTYTLKSAGVYTFRVYNEYEVWITTGVLEVMMK